MKRVIRFFGWALLVLVVLGLVAAGAAHLLAQRKLNRAIEVNVAPVAFASGGAALARGRYLFQSRGCGECHGDNGGGKLLIDDPGGLRVWTPNIAPGPGSRVAKYTEADWVRTIRHGVKPDKRPILIMPCEDYNRFTDADVAAIVAYVRKKYGLIIGQQTAEQVKIKIGSAVSQDEEKSIEIQGQDQVTGLPRPITLTTGEIVDALEEPLHLMVETARRVLEKTPPELVSDIIDRGVAICGGGALLRGVDRLITKELGVPAYLVDNPTTCTAEGAARAVRMKDALKRNLPVI